MMNRDRKFYNLGCGWISGIGYGTFGSKPQFSGAASQFKIPDLKGYIPELPARFGRFDCYTEVCFSTAVLALHDAGLLKREGKKNMGIVVGSSSGVYDNDIHYYGTTIEDKGAFSSPNLFSYTLPNVALGEIAVFFKFVGPAFCVGNDPANPGLDGMGAALSLLESAQCDCILVGWVEAAQEIKNAANFAKGAAFAVITLNKTANTKAGFSLNQKFQFIDLFEVQNG